MKNIITTMLVLVAVAVLSTGVFASNTTSGIELQHVRINGEIVRDNDNIRVDLGDVIDVRVRLQAHQDIRNLEVSARIVGYEYNDVHTLFDVTRPFDLQEGDTRSVDLQLSIPIRAEKDEYHLRIDIDDRTTRYESETYTLRVRGPRSALRIRDVIFSPVEEVMTGRALLTQVRLQNIGERSLDDVKVTATIEGLGVSGQVFLAERIRGSLAGRGDSEVTEEIFIRIPECATPGTYTVVITVEYDEFNRVSTTRTIRVVKGDSLCPGDVVQPPVDTGRTIVTTPPAQTIAAGQSGTFPITITNTGTTARTYVLTVSGIQGWATAEFTDAAPLVGAGQSRTVYAYVTVASDAQVGDRSFVVDVSSDTSTAQVAMTAKIQEGVADATGFATIRRSLEIGLIVLIVLLVILGLIIGLSRMRERDDEDEGKSQAYY